MENDDHHEEHKAFHSSLQQRARSMFTKMESNKDGDGGRTLDSLIMVMPFLGETNKGAVKVLRRWKDDIFRSRELTELLKECFTCCHKIVEFLNALEEWLTRISLRLQYMKTVLHDFKSDQSCMLLLQKRLEDFMTAATNTQTTDTLFAKLNAILTEQYLLHERLQAVNINNTTVPLKTFRKVSIVIMASVYAGLVACAVVSAVLSPGMAIPPLLAFAVIASLNPTDHIQTWINEMFALYEDKLIRMRGELVSGMRASTMIAMTDLEGIRMAIQELQEKTQAKSMVKDIEKKIDEFAKAVKVLKTKKDKCYEDVKDAKNKMIGMTGGGK